MSKLKICFFATLMGFVLLFAGGCKTDVEPASSKGKEDAKTPVPVLISYDSRELTCCIDEGVAVPGSTVMSGTELTIIPAEGEPVLFLTANGLPLPYSGDAATITLPDTSPTMELKVEKRQALAEEAGQYNVRILFGGEATFPVSTTERIDNLFTQFNSYFSKGSSDRWQDFKLCNGAYLSSGKGYKDWLDSSYSETFAQAPHAVVVSLGLAELEAESFDETAFASWCAGILSGYGRARPGAVVVAVGLPPLAILPSVEKSRYEAVDRAIRSAVRSSGAILVDVAGLYATDPNLASDATKAKRRITEEIFLSFYSRIEAQAGNPGDMMIDGKPITTTPRQKWSGTDDGNQDTAKRELIQTIASGDKTKWPQVVFIGDSITDFYDGTYDNDSRKLKMTDWWNKNVGWGNNKVLDESGSAATYRALNLGNSGDFTQSLLYRLQKIPGDDGSGAYTGAFQFKDTVKAVVLMIGTNNIGVSSPSSTAVGNTKYQERPISTVEAVKGIQAVIGVLKKGFPNAKIILMGVLPRGTKTQRDDVDFIRLQVLSTNRQLYDLYGSGQDSRVQLLDLYENFVDSAGVQKSGSLEALGDVGTCDKLFFDTVHPNNAGYKVWWDNLKPILDVILQ
ncbi:MAG: hypothetical protein J6K76_04160 [Spirochaetaceae bacterium]|nr:hypothetical protein [Spirochaetaceae bacterium]